MERLSLPLTPSRGLGDFQLKSKHDNLQRGSLAVSHSGPQFFHLSNGGFGSFVKYILVLKLCDFKHYHTTKAIWLTGLSLITTIQGTLTSPARCLPMCWATPGNRGHGEVGDTGFLPSEDC